MKTKLSRPVTIDSTVYGERWFPFVFRTTDGTLLLYAQYGFDTHFSPAFRIESHDNGRTWGNPIDNVPRLAWCHAFADGELFEMDSYGVHDPKTSADAVHFGCWSFPSRSTDVPRKGFVRVRNSSLKKVCLTTLRGYPSHPWWNLWNTLHGTDQLTGNEIFLNGPYLTDGLELPDGRLLAAGYWSHVILYESRDRGRTWDEVAFINDEAKTGIVANETAMVRLDDGRLYVVCRTETNDSGMHGGRLMHAWSEDLGKTWSRLEPMKLVDSDHAPLYAWPRLCKLTGGGLALVYGRPGKHLVFDPSGTGTQWQGRIDLHQWELDTQALNGVPPGQRLRGIVGEDMAKRCDRHTDSGDYLAVVEIAPRELLVFYDVHHYIEHWNAKPCAAIRMVNVRLE